MVSVSVYLAIRAVLPSDTCRSLGSSMCFILASFNQCDPRTTKAAWGHTADEMDDASWAILNGASSLLVNNQDVATRTNALVTLVRITRLDLAEGLAQLCFPDINWKEEVGI